MAKKTIPVNNYNDSDNYGTSGEAPSLYSDKHYLDGDGFLYGLGMASQRMIVKGKGDDIDTDHFAWTSASTMGKLILRVDSLVSGGLVTANSGNRLAVNPGNGLYIDAINQNKLAVSLFKKQKTPQSTPYNASGLEFATGAEWGGAPAAGQLRIKLSETGSGTSYINTSGLVLKDPGDIGNSHVTEGLMVNYDNVTIGLNASNQLEIKASAIGQGLKVVTESGQQYRIDVMPGDYTEIKTMGDSGNQYTAVDVDIPALFAQVTRDKSIYGIGITPNSDASHSNNLYIDGSVLAGDGLQGTGYSDSDSTITPKLKLKIANGSPLYINNTNKALNLRIGDGLIVTNTSTAPTLQFAMGSGFVKSGESIDVDAYNGITVDSNGVSVKPKSNSGIAVDANGVSVKIKPTSGIGVDSNGVYLKAASTSEIGGVKLGTDTAPDEGMNASNLYLLKNSSGVAYVKTYVYGSFPQGSSALYYPYSADYINQNYSTNTQIDTKIATAISDISGREYKIFPTLPAKGESQSWADFYAAYKKYIALVSNTGAAPDAYKEYILIVTNESTGECHWEQIGDTEFTTDNFVAKTDVLTQAEVASIVQDVFGF